MLYLTTKCPPPSETNAFSEPGEWFTHMLDRFRQSVKMSQVESPPRPITFPARRVAFFPDSVTFTAIFHNFLLDRVCTTECNFPTLLEWNTTALYVGEEEVTDVW